MNKVTDVKLLQELKSNLLGFWPNRKNNNFPGSLPISISRKHFDRLIKYEYYISLKSDGTRYMLMSYNGIVYLVNRMFNFYETDQQFDPSIYGSIVGETCGFLFDGELIKNEDFKNPESTTSGSTYLIHDCICIFSKDVSNQTFIERYEEIKIALSMYMGPAGDARPVTGPGTGKDRPAGPGTGDFSIKIKKFYKFQDFNQEIIDNVDHKIDGIIFTPVLNKHTIFKWKYKHTFDFLIRDEGLKYVCYVSENQELSKYADVKKSNVTFSRLLKKNCPSFTSGSIVECIYNKEADTYEPIIIRNDKSHPNSRLVSESTLENIQEDITVEELLDVVRKAVDAD
jgi:mRNA-capping enzyme